MIHDDPLQTFVAESRELLREMEDALLRLEHGPEDADTIHAMFRAAHTIKGSAGLFGLDEVVAFTHAAESVLDRVRDGEIRMDGALIALFLYVRDHLDTLLDAVAENRETDEAVRETGQRLVAELEGVLEARSIQAAPGHLSEPVAPVEAAGGGKVETDNWHISLRFGSDVLRNGMDPLAFVRYLTSFGEIINIVTLADDVPCLSELDPESCHLGFEISFRSDADKATIESAFDFVREESQIRILPPHSKVSEYLRLIEDLPEDAMPLGELLVRCGTLTQAELDAVLRSQGEQAGAAPRPIGEVLVERQLVEPAVVEAALDKQKQVREHKIAEASLIRVDAGKLDQLINLVGELIIAGAAADNAARRAGSSELVESTMLLSRLVEDVRDSALRLRMVQIGATFNRFQRVVRDIAKEVGKDIELAISGGDTELDKTVVERIADPLTHLVRNAIDHGIEPAEERQAAGKPAVGSLRLNAYHDAGSIVIEVSDDGRGLNRQKIVQRAIERGLIGEDHNLSDKEICDLVFAPGFSTADQVSNLSGRGVGMDVVKSNITGLRGTVVIDSVEGRGTMVRIRLPLTLAIIDGFLVGVGRSAYVLPLDMVVECIELPPTEADAERSADYLNLRGKVLPLIRLREMFEVAEEPVRRENVVVMQCAGQYAGLVVDRLMGEHQTVIKPLGNIFSHTRGIGGFTILGNGEVALILDVAGLVREVTARDDGRAAVPAPGMIARSA